jgi:nicotinate-nucleotide adenylyltransferase
MVVLATMDEPGWVPSLLESPERRPEHGANYSIDTLRHFKHGLARNDRIFSLIGIDAFLEIATWREPEALLREAEFIVVSRPGFSLADVGTALPAKLRPSEKITQAMRKQPAAGQIVLPGATIHLLEGVAEPVSATQIRLAAEKGRPLDRLVGVPVAQYIRKQGLYRGGAMDRRLAAAPSRLKVLPGGKLRRGR